ncbi:glycerophosphodiester phosphodiesterase [Latilactobacillus curvatus]|uniref:glycerophosphodiester phosphodiesterase n=1 Tax=Latilactobacillus curvatus TaxID=28038 RepID=UPI000FF8C628|nr:glycerophosphodiester phosphodiesterase [Latilactobacillus curvatus]MCT3530535.1 glycerophosphodiester phosphodiesterase [Latilactobacillus curvatus]MDG2989227.1 glycerophosphodiester phosphodiesterase [Latilactobacillus curvatus]QAS49007.1 glycerophosphodiester phosphodiesterase [Latilactobacillus curvatus JCM 1096 = DSM 20019]GED82820.1 glycerophosphoryl diester phosphodiesterase [Latilactobacillus curvatus]
MQYFKTLFTSTFTFLKQSQAYFRSVLLMHGFLLLICLPLLSKASYFILVHNQIQFLALSNLPALIHQHPIALLALVGIALLILLLAFFEFTFLLLSVYFIQIKRPLALQALLKMTFAQLRHLRIGTFFFFLYYCLLILPLGGLGYHSDLLTKFKIPAFILDYILMNRRIVAGLFILVYLGLLYLGLRLIFTLPNIILQQMTFKKALTSSWQFTHQKIGSLLGRLLLIGAALIGFTGLTFFLLIQLQALIETHTSVGLPSAVVIMTLLQAAMLINLVLSTVAVFFIVIDYLLADPQFVQPTFNYATLKLSVPLSGRWLLFVANCVLIGVGTYNWDYLRSVTIQQPLSISHRGVSQKDGVQNSISALRKTTRLKPDYVEMDVQLTKDHQFVVFHDFQLAPLTGHSGTPQSKTLAQLTKMTVHEHRQSAPIASFDDYLARANQLHQKLLIEIKTPTTDNPGLVQHFLNKYQANIEAHGHMVQSLNWHIVEAVKKAAPKIQTGYILPFNFIGPPISNADFYAVEMTTINSHFIQAAHQENKAVFVWTPNDQQAVHRMMYFGADGVVTDNLTAVKQAKQQNNQRHYADKLAYYVIGIG